MKKIILLVSSFILITSLYAQQSVSKLYVLQFRDKGISTDVSVNPSLYLTDKAIERRIKQKIAFDQSDIPVNEQYVKSISETGARVLTRSRWFNNVVIEATPEIITAISALSFIEKVQQLGEKANDVSAAKSVKFEAEQINPWNKGFTKKAPTDIYDYGAAYNQINQLQGQYLHNNGYSGQGMTIAVLDAGFNSADVMPCFDSLRANNQILGTTDIAQPGNNVYGTWMHTHGTSVLSCMGAYVSGQMIGTAPKANYWLIRTEVGESEHIIEEYYWVSGAEFADSVGADLINSSLGYTTFDPPSTTDHTYADMDGNTTFVTIGADKAAEKGILVVNSAGNSGGGGWWYIGAPADGDSVFTIGAVDMYGNRAYFSSVGPTYDGRLKPTVDAQGQEAALYFPGGFGAGSGTSFSSPITCGITACLWQALPAYNNMQVIELMKATASQASAPDSLLGWGIPNVKTALTTLSVHTQSAEKELHSYPNPVFDKLTLGFPDAIRGEYQIEIVNLQGQVVYSQKGNAESTISMQINNIGNLNAGIYFVRVANGIINYSTKILKE